MPENMSTTEALYNQWSAQYDHNENKTRDVEAVAMRKMLADIHFRYVLEIGAGTGKNTKWYAGLAERLVAVDLSPAMLAQARVKVDALGNPACLAEFRLADVTAPWTFGEGIYDLVAFSLVLEHIADLEPIFAEVQRALVPGGHVYIGELHPFKQYAGSKARFETSAGMQVVDCFPHHISDFLHAAAIHGLALVQLEEFFDADDRKGLPRILALVLRKVG